MCLVAGLSVYTFFMWLMTFTSRSRMSFVKRYLKVNERLGYVAHHHNHHHSSSSTSSTIIDAKILDAFVYEYLKQDGVFLLRIVKKNTNDIIVGELVCSLWDNFKRFPKFAIQHHNVDESLQKENEKLNGLTQPILSQNGDSIPNYHH